jgi:hypothetical protein
VRFLDTGELLSRKPIAKAVQKYVARLSFRNYPDERVTDRQLIFTYDNGLVAPYLEPAFRGDLVNRIHSEFGHLGWPGLNGVIRPRA